MAVKKKPPAVCAHPKNEQKNLGWTMKCGRCGAVRGVDGVWR